MALITEGSHRVSIGLGLKAYRDTFRFKGRSTRTEVVSLWLVSILVVAIGGLALSPFDLKLSLTHALGTDLPRTILILTLQAVPFLPLFALAARRAQDFGVYGWPVALISLAAFVMGVWRDLHFRTVDVGLPPGWIEFARILGCIVLYVALFAPGSEGTNRFGANPRLDAAPVVAPATA